MKVLLVALHYHHYTDQIADELRAQGHEVVLHDIQPRTLPMRALRVAAPGVWRARLARHHRAILDAERGTTYDVVVFIQVAQMARATMARFRDQFPTARFVLYNWDSVEALDYTGHADLFDHVMTFDPGDAAQYGYEYLPLFCVRTFQGLPRREQDRRGVYFVGNVVTLTRFDALAAFRDYCAREGIRLQAYLACTPVVQARLLRAGRSLTGLSRGSIAPRAFRDMIETSTAVFDFANHRQAGYTMRVIENLCAGKKIITSNARVLNETFYSPDRFHVFAGLDFTGIAEFLCVPLAAPDETFPAYHVQSFVQHLLAGRGHELPT